MEEIWAKSRVLCKHCPSLLRMTFFDNYSQMKRFSISSSSKLPRYENYTVNFLAINLERLFLGAATSKHWAPQQTGTAVAHKLISVEGPIERPTYSVAQGQHPFQYSKGSLATLHKLMVSLGSRDSFTCRVSFFCLTP